MERINSIHAIETSDGEITLEINATNQFLIEFLDKVLDRMNEGPNMEGTIIPFALDAMKMSLRLIRLNVGLEK